MEVVSRRSYNSLKCNVIQSFVAAHQHFAVRTLGWILDLFKKSSGFRTLFCEVVFSVSSVTRWLLKFSLFWHMSDTLEPGDAKLAWRVWHTWPEYTAWWLLNYPLTQGPKGIVPIQWFFDHTIFGPDFSALALYKLPCFCPSPSPAVGIFSRWPKNPVSKILGRKFSVP